MHPPPVEPSPEEKEAKTDFSFDIKVMDQASKDLVTDNKNNQ